MSNQPKLSRTARSGLNDCEAATTHFIREMIRERMAACNIELSLEKTQQREILIDWKQRLSEMGEPPMSAM